jgi:hypothetical protein
VSGWVKCAILQVVQWFRGGEEFWGNPEAGLFVQVFHNLQYST